MDGIVSDFSWMRQSRICLAEASSRFVMDGIASDLSCTEQSEFIMDGTGFGIDETDQDLFWIEQYRICHGRFVIDGIVLDFLGRDIPGFVMSAIVSNLS